MLKIWRSPGPLGSSPISSTEFGRPRKPSPAAHMTKDARVASHEPAPMSGQRQLIKVILIAALVVLLARISPATPYLNSQGFDSGCQTLAYLEYGQGKPLVLLAGGPGMNPAYMVPIAKMLAAGNRRVLLLHQRGTGSSVDAISCRDRMNLAE